MASFDSPYYPYEKVQTGFNSMDGAEELPLKLCRYLLDLPDRNGYSPVDDNTRPRVKLIKYLYYDDTNPLGQAMPTPQQKLSLLYDGTTPDLNTDEGKAAHPKGYRIIPFSNMGQSQLTAQTLMKIYVGRVIPISPMKAEIGIVVDFVVNTNIESALRAGALGKSYAMETALIAALNGVNIGGVGTVSFSRVSHVDGESRNIYDENGVNVGRRVNLSVTWMESAEVDNSLWQV